MGEQSQVDVADETPRERGGDERLIWFVLSMVGVGAIVVGCFLPLWDTSSVTFLKIQGNSAVQASLGWTNLVLSALAAIAIARAYQTGNRTLAPLIWGGLAVIWAVYTATSDTAMTLCPAGPLASLGGDCQTAKPGLGVYAIGGGGAALVIAGLFLLKPRIGYKEKGTTLEQLEALEKQRNVASPAYYEKKKAELTAQLRAEQEEVAAQLRAERIYRECPHCKEQMRRDAGTCPHCRKESPAWTLENGYWWRTDAEGKWDWLDEETASWRPSSYSEGRVRAPRPVASPPSRDRRREPPR